MVGRGTHVGMDPKASMYTLPSDTCQRANRPPKQGCPDSASWKRNTPVAISRTVFFVTVAFKRIILPTLSDHRIPDRVHFFGNDKYTLLRNKSFLERIEQQNGHYDDDKGY